MQRWPLLLLVLLLASCNGQQPDAGRPPEGSYLEVFGPHAAALRPELGDTFTDGYEVVKVVDTTSLVITRIESRGGEPSLKYLGAMVTGQERRLGAIQLLPDFPPTERRLGELTDATGATLSGEGEAARLGYELLLGYTWSDDQAATRTEVNVYYEVDGREYVQTIPGQLVVCPKPQTTQACLEDATS